jgi:general secretion pathway protein F
VPMFAYKGVDNRGKAVSGAKDADTPKMLRALLRRDGVIVTDVTEARAGKAAAHGSGLKREVDLGGLFGGSGVKKLEVAAFTRQMATLLKAGIPLAEALGAIFEQIDNPRLRSTVGEVKSKVNEGSSFADALFKHPKIFEPIFVSMVRAGETAGNLDQVLARLADFMEAQIKLRGKITGAMVYPIIMVIVASIVMTILMVAVVPKITAMYADTDRVLPWNTQFLIWFADMVGKFWWLGAIAFPLASWGFRKWTRSPAGKPIWDRFVLRLPIVGPLVRQIVVGRFCRTLGTMLASGVQLLRALEVSKDILGNQVLVKAIEVARDQIQQGESIAATLKKSGQFPSLVTHMIAVGERAGQLEQMLNNVADAFDSEADMKLGRLTTILEPLMIVLMAGGVAFVVFSILTPIMDMNPDM